MGKFHQDNLKKVGFTIDNHCNPPVAYKGVRFDPTELKECYTELESELIKILIDIGEDFQYPEEIQKQTGLPIERCEYIFDVIRNLVNANW